MLGIATRPYGYSTYGMIPVLVAGITQPSQLDGLDIGRAFTRKGKPCGSGSILVTHAISDATPLFPEYRGNEHPFIGTYFEGREHWDDEAHADNISYSDGLYTMVRRWYPAYGNGYWCIDLYSCRPYFKLVNGVYTEFYPLATSVKQSPYSWSPGLRYGFRLTGRKIYLRQSAGWPRSRVPQLSDILPYYHDTELMKSKLSATVEEETCGTGYGSYQPSEAPDRIVRDATTNLDRASLANLFPSVMHRSGGSPAPVAHIPSPLGEVAWFDQSFQLVSLPYLYDAMSLAAVDLYRSLPESQVNIVANVIDAINLAKSLGKGFSIASETMLQDAYLSYRYSYSTTKQDILDLAALARRLRSLLGVTFTQHGRATRSYKWWSTEKNRWYTATVTAKCSAKFFSSDFVDLDVLRKIDQMGLRLNAYNAWDLIPFSFIVDWILPVQDMLAVCDQIYRNGCVNYRNAQWTTSVTVTFETDEGTVCNYARRFNYAPELRVLSAWSGVKRASATAWYYHIADALAIFIK